MNRFLNLRVNYPKRIPISAKKKRVSVDKLFKKKKKKRKRKSAKIIIIIRNNNRCVLYSKEKKKKINERTRYSSVCVLDFEL